VNRRLLDRLLRDPAFRSAYLAAGGSPLEALDVRESRSSLAGVALGLAVEGAALLGLAEGGPGGAGRLVFDTDGAADLRAGRIDPRVVALLDHLSREHRITVSSMRSDHGTYTAGGSVSNHASGRAVDIATVDGQPVSPGNAAARKLAESLAALDPRLRPTEIGTPWALDGPAYFTDADHQDHLHLAYDDPPGPEWEDDGVADAEPPEANPPEADDEADDDADADDEDDEDDEDEDDDDEDSEDGCDDEDEDEPDEDEPDEDEDDEDEDGGADGDHDDDSGDTDDGDDGASGGEPPPAPAPDAPADAVAAAYPGDAAGLPAVADWMAGHARARGLPGELPVMAALVESGLRNLDYGHADSVGFFQMRTSIWDQGEYAGYAGRPELQLQWFLDQAEAVMKQRVARGLPVDDPRHFGEWIADVERPAEQYRGRYQLRLDEARALLERATSGVRKLRLITAEQAAAARDQG
jgi:hypothetical protein